MRLPDGTVAGVLALLALALVGFIGLRLFNAAVLVGWPERCSETCGDRGVLSLSRDACVCGSRCP